MELGRSSEITSLESEKEWFEGSGKKEERAFSIISIEEEKVIGNCSIMRIDSIHRTAKIGIIIGKEEDRNKGYGKEVLNLMLDFGFNYLNLHNIALDVFSFNERAIKAYEQVGFKEIGRRRESYYLNGKYYDNISMDILEKEFTGNYIKNKNI